MRYLKGDLARCAHVCVAVERDSSEQGSGYGHTRPPQVIATSNRIEEACEGRSRSAGGVTFSVELREIMYMFMDQITI